MTKHFLDTLEDRGPFSYQRFPEETGAKQKPMIFHGTFQEVCSQLHAANQQGSGIFVTINRTDGRGRKKENILATRAVFVDLDGAPLQPVREAPLMPHMIIESSPGKFHAYWMIEHLPLEEFTQVQKWLAEKFSGDTQVCDLSRCMRLPGFHHLKGGSFLNFYT
jgi:hypothetical protein